MNASGYSPAVEISLCSAFEAIIHVDAVISGIDCDLIRRKGFPDKLE